MFDICQTIINNTIVIIENTTMNTIKEKTITIREVHRNLSAITMAVKKGGSFVITKNAKPVFRITPVNMKEYTIQDLRALQFDSGEKQVSQHIDEIVYGV